MGTEPQIHGFGFEKISVIRILLVSEYAIQLAALSALIEREPGLSVVGGASWDEAPDKVDGKPDVVLLDLTSRNEIALNFVADLVKAGNGARVLILTESDQSALYLNAVQMGAMGVVNKGESASVLFEAIRTVHSGALWLHASMVRQLLQRKPPEHPASDEAKIASLTRREFEVIGLISEGRKNKQIAERLFISECTVRHHLTSIFDKLGIEDRLELLIYAYQHGLATPPPPVRPIEFNKDIALNLVRRLTRTA